MIAQPISTIRYRLKDAIARRQRGLPVSDDELDLLLRIQHIIETVDGAIEGEIDKKTRSRKGVADMIHALEDAAYDAESAASDLKHALGELRSRLDGIGEAA